MSAGESATRSKSEAALAIGERHVVAVDHFGASRRAQDMGNVAGIASSDPLCMQRVIGDETAADFGALSVPDSDAIAACESPLDPSHPCGQQTLAGNQRLRGARVDMDGAFQLQRAADPDFSRR